MVQIVAIPLMQVPADHNRARLHDIVDSGRVLLAAATLSQNTNAGGAAHPLTRHAGQPVAFDGTNSIGRENRARD